MFTKNFSEIDVGDFKNLIDQKTTENQQLEFKRESWGRDDEGTRELLRDVSSMANAYGGYFIIGMEEDQNGIATTLKEVIDAETERDRILGCCLSNLQPRIIGFDIRTIEIETGKSLLLIKVPSSLNLHQIIFKGLYQFWIRHDRQKTKMSFDEIKDGILKNFSSSERVEKFINLKTEQFLKSLDTEMLLMAIPIKLENELFKIDNAEIRGILRESSLDRRYGYNFSFLYPATPSLNGLQIIDGQTMKSQRLEFYRNGYFEGRLKITDNFVDEENLKLNGVEQKYPLIINVAIVEYIYSFINRLRSILEIIHYESPYHIKIVFHNIKGLVLPKFKRSSLFRYDHYKQWEEGDLIIEPITYESIIPNKIVKELSDRVWNAFGFDHEPYFDGQKFNF